MFFKTTKPRDEEEEEQESLTLGGPANKSPLSEMDSFFTKRSMVIVFLLAGLLASVIIFSSTPSSALETAAVKATNLDNNEDVLSEYFVETTPTELMQDEEANCTSEAFADLQTNTYEYKLRLANCGGRTTTKLPVSQRPFRILLVGEEFAAGKSTTRLSGCPVHTSHNACPMFPRCTFDTVKTVRESHKADMIVVSSQEYHLAKRAASFAQQRRPIRVLYQREPYWQPAPQKNQLEDFDLTMTGFVNAGIMNPPFLRRPMRFFATKPSVEFIPFQKRTGFALSIISLCRASSLRKIYLTHLTDYLGKDRVHQYGKCGHMQLPPPPIINAAKVIAQYKFFLAFENSLLTNYVSEKLLTVLTMPLLPVYRGGRPSLNITKKPSFIDVSNFPSPKALAIYLLRLDANPEEYAKYHEWRTDPEPFTDQYLELAAKQLPGKLEMEPLKHEPVATRRAMCCRLCDPDIVARAMEEHGQNSLIPPRIHGETALNNFSFNGTLGIRNPGTLLVPFQDTFVESGVHEEGTETKREKETAPTADDDYEEV